MLYFSRAVRRRRKIGMHGIQNPKKQHKAPLLSKYPAFLHIKHGPQTNPQQPVMQKQNRYTR